MISRILNRLFAYSKVYIVPVSSSVAVHKPLIDYFVPDIGRWGILYKTLSVVAFATLTTVFALYGRFYLPNNPVPVSLQTLGALLAGGFLGWRLGSLSMILYYLWGLFGLPVFANGNSGIQYTFGVTGGYLIGFIFASFGVGWLSQFGFSKWNSIWAILIGSILVYLPALIWLSVFDFGWPAEGELLSSAVYPFIVGDAIKMVIAYLVIGSIWQITQSISNIRRSH